MIDTKQSLGQESRFIKIDVSHSHSYRHSPRKRETTRRELAWIGTVILGLTQNPQGGEVAWMWDDAGVLFSPYNPSVKCQVTLTFDSSPIKGEGDDALHRCVDSRFRGE